MRSIKTVKVPLHYGNTQTKIRKLDKLTARLTYGVWLWSDIIDKERILSRTKLSPFEKEIQEKTKLSAGFVQQCKDKAIWCWRQYKTSHKVWRRKLRKAKEGTTWYNKLLKREPSIPFTSPRSRMKKCPVKVDSRTGVTNVDLKLTQWILNASSLVKGQRISLLLNPSKYHLKQLGSGDITSFEIIRKNKKYYAHISVHYEVTTQPITAIQGVDLGVKRDIASVRLPLTPTNFQIVNDVEKRSELKKLSDRISHLRRLEKWDVLKRMRSRRMNVAVDHDIKLAKEFASTCNNSLVVIGHPQYISYNHYKGNGSKIGRKILSGWSFNRRTHWIIHQCNKLGILAGNLNEWHTSSRCHKCDSKVQRNKSRIVCTECGMQYDADFNASIKIVQKGNAQLDNKSSELSKQLRQNLAGATVDLARNWRGFPTHGMSPESQLPK